MINLKQNIVNTAIFTLEERIVAENIYVYYMTLTNCTSNESFLVEITDYSLNIGRYNKCFIIPKASIDSLIVKSGQTITLDENTVYFINNTLGVEVGGTLVIPMTTLIYVKSGANVYVDGTCENLINIVLNAYTNTPVGLNLMSDFDSGISITYLIDFLPGFYDYSIKNFTDETLLEIGKLYIEDNTSAEPITYINNEEKTIIYNG